jgi:uncharacterized protein (TIGR02597 family)
MGPPGRVIGLIALLFLMHVISGQRQSAAAPTPEVASESVGIIQIPIVAGANFISAPLHKIHSYRGVVLSTTEDIITVTGTPGWTMNQFGPKDGYYQFIVIVRKSGAISPNHEGDWWPTQGNSANALTVLNHWQDPATALQAGDHIEVRHLTSIKDLFGTGSSVLLNKDSNGFPSPSEEDLIRYVAGTGFGADIFYHGGSIVPEGYYVGDAGPFDGSTLTLWPDQAFMFFRKTGSASMNVKIIGQLQMTRLTHYLRPGANSIGTGFATPAAVGNSDLSEAGWISDANGFPNITEEDLIRTVAGTGFEKDIFHHNSGNALADTGWYVADTLNNDWQFEVGKGYFVFIKGPEMLVWRQKAP